MAAAGAAAGSSISVSLRSRGLVILNPQRDVRLRHQAKAAAGELLNVGCAIIYNVVLLSWSAWFSVVVNLLSAVFFYNYKQGELRSDASLMLPFCFLVYLPVLWMVHTAYSRRSRAQEALTTVKASIMGVHTLCSSLIPEQATDKLEELQATLVLLLDDLQVYLQHPRSNTKLFELNALTHNPNVSTRLCELSQEIGVLQRRVHRGMKDLYTISSSLLGLGVSEQQVGHVVGLLVQLQQAIEALSGCKELRTPVMLRAAMCSYATVVVPVFFGPFVTPIWTSTGPGPSKLVYGIVVGVMLQVMLMTLFKLAVSLEDPFDPVAPDVLSFAETKDQILYMLSPDDDEAADTLPTSLEDQAAAASPYSGYKGQPGGGLDAGGVVLGMPPMPHLT